jgi:hypothetical protein
MQVNAVRFPGLRFPALHCRTIQSAVMALGASCAFAAAAQPQWQGAAFKGDRGGLERLAAAGATVIRVYGEDDAWVLDEAQRLGLRVIMGVWVRHPRHGARLDDTDALRAQEQAITRFVSRYRNHPALLAWSVGNEVETGQADPLPAWREVDRLAGVVKALDPRHPTMMVVADTVTEQLKPLAGCCANVDLLGLNVYGGAVFDLPQRLRAAGITKPVVLTELGPLGQWQAGRKPWGAPVELTSSEKAAFFRDALAFLRTQPQVAGTFAFLWGAKQEQTATWHGLLLADGSPTAMSDALSAAWGTPVAEPAPRIRGIGIAADEFAPRQEISAGVDAVAFDGSPLRTEWKVLAEATDLRRGGDAEATPADVPVRIVHADAASVRFVAPERPGAYRLFMTLRDRNGKAATANLPFLVR